MAGSLLERARKDALRFSSQGGFETSVTFTPPTGDAVTADALAMKHHIGVDTDGQLMHSLNARITVSEKLLTDEGYTTRNGNNEVSMRGHKVAWEDASGESKTYKITENWPDESLGTITLILGDYAA